MVPDVPAAGTVDAAARAVTFVMFIAFGIGTGVAADIAFGREAITDLAGFGRLVAIAAIAALALLAVAFPARAPSAPAARSLRKYVPLLHRLPSRVGNLLVSPAVRCVRRP